MVEIKFVLTHPDAKLPVQNNETDSGFDVFSVENAVVPANGSVSMISGIKVGYITPGFWFKIEARSGLSFKHNIVPHFGVIDQEYRGETNYKLYNFSDKDYEIKKGDKIAQIVVYKRYNTKISAITEDEIEQTTRGEKGIGSSGR